MVELVYNSLMAGIDYEFKKVDKFVLLMIFALSATVFCFACWWLVKKSFAFLLRLVMGSREENVPDSSEVSVLSEKPAQKSSPKSARRTVSPKRASRTPAVEVEETEAVQEEETEA